MPLIIRPERTVGISRVCRESGLTPGEVRGAVKRGALPMYRYPSDRRPRCRFRLSDVWRWLASAERVRLPLVLGCRCDCTPCTNIRAARK